jgi:hypothetical protein
MFHWVCSTAAGPARVARGLFTDYIDVMVSTWQVVVHGSTAQYAHCYSVARCESPPRKAGWVATDVEGSGVVFLCKAHALTLDVTYLGI